MDLFNQRFNINKQKYAPLADRMRPEKLEDFLGQDHIVGQGKLLRRAIQSDVLHSCLFFGAPGCGKTTLANIIAKQSQSKFEMLNAVTAGVKELREVIDAAKERLALYDQTTYLLLDECHRWSKAQSDSILPALEKGVIRFIGSTTENPMIAMTGAIISRCQVFQFYPLSNDHIISALLRAIHDSEKGLGQMQIKITEEALNYLSNRANGDVRIALNALELAALSTPTNAKGVIHINIDIASESIQQKIMVCDQEQYYNMLSAFCKSLRGSDSDAALFWFARLIYAGVDPKIIVRRMIAHASEDIGMANSNALVQCVSAAKSLELIGMPEARLPIAQAIIYLCESPKSNSVLLAVNLAYDDAQRTRDEPVPLHLRDTSYKGATALGNGKGYKYPHDFPAHYVKQQYRPANINKQYYLPSNQGQEFKIAQNKNIKNNPRLK